ncbi:MAG TPA: O-antigen ligase family protein [Solirubrobacterales bacterium]|nr:O-antigen ligase family protein [Solirubrobacterales bacterium]
MSESLRRLISANPSAPLLAVATVLFVWMSADEGGFHGTTFLPMTLALLALLVVGLLALPLPRPSRAQWTAVGLIAGYAAWSYLSITWADQQGMAWDGANRTAMYAIVFALFALWPIRGPVAAAIAAAYALGIAGIGIVELLRAAATDNPIAFLNEGRLSEPTGYANANVALWMTAFWPALLLAGRRELPAWLRGPLLGSAGLLVALAMLGQSRGWVVVMPAMVLLAVALIPGRGRTIAALALVGVAIAAISHPLLEVFRQFDADTVGSQGMDEAARATLVAFVLLTFAGVAWALVDRAPVIGSTQRRRLGTAVVVGFAVTCLAGLAAFSVVRGNPVSESADAWNEFKDGTADSSSGSARLGTIGGSYRYDYWRVAWDSFEESPLIGVGADNFGREYLLHGESGQTPAYPHSVEMRTLAQTGLIGTLLLLGGIVAALVAAARPIRRMQGIAPVAAGTGIVVFAYFIAHGSLDWFWEFPALGAPAFALLGMATAISTRSDRLDEPSLDPAWRRAAIAGGAVLTLALAVSLTMPWLAERELRSARELTGEDPAAALVKLDRAAELNPLSPLPDKTAAVIERQLGDLPGAEQRFRETLEVDPGDPFVYLQLATIASATGREREAIANIRRARELNPRDAVSRQVARRLEAGQRVTPAEVDELILSDVEERIGPD